jgi:hypothetical protein
MVTGDAKIGIETMTPWMKFLIRAVLGIGLAIILSRFFFNRFSFPAIVGLAVFLVGMGTMSEHIRKRK